MKRILLLLLCAGCLLTAKADHITGGEMYYTFAGINNATGEYQYDFTLKLFMRCNSGRFFSDPTVMSVFDRVTGVRIEDISVPLGNQENLAITNTNPCITDPPPVCYVVGYFYWRVTLPSNINGYIVSSQVNYRVIGINNLGIYTQLGATYTAEIPGKTDGIADAPSNNGAHFTGNDLVIICENNSFSYSFAAEDADHDELRYSFCNAYGGGNTGTPGNSLPASAPPYASLPYGMPAFNPSYPLGGRVNINSSTGLITGFAPAAGKYVVTVCVEEIRNGKLIATQRKDLQINIAACTIAAATLEPLYTVCKDVPEIQLSDLSNSPLIKTYYWQLINAAGNVILNSTLESPTYTFPDTGLYTVKLQINKNDLCADTASAPVKVYPGFKPAFTYSGICINKPTVFKDASTSKYGTVTSWQWDFGELYDYNNFSDLSSPTYTYPDQGYKNVRLIVTDSKGCIDSITKEVTIVAKPPIDLRFRDSLICVSDKVQLLANGSGNFTWTPAANIINAASNNPIVSPAVTTTYYANLNDNGCTNTDSVKIRVVDHVDLQTMADTVICSGDSIRLRLVSNGLQYAWTPAAQLIDPAQANPFAITNNSTLYQVIARIGSCVAKDEVLVNTVPYPKAYAGIDTLICYQTSAQLHGTTDGKSFLWTPGTYLTQSNTLNPVAKPAITTSYVLVAFDTKGCPKPGFDTVIVKVLPPIHAFAGNDTTIVVNQPLQLKASGGIRYLWSPPNNLSADNISNPIATITSANARLEYKVLVYNEANCVDSASIRLRIYKSPPTVFVPNAFSPNGDGKNDLLRPIAAGILKLDHFNVYNRWGQLVYSGLPSAEGGGWDGKHAGKDQPVDTYVWELRATDYYGKVFTEKGLVLLIR
ncbi:MAG: PKD domain-containing protein [Chitinophagaceae bacterium]